MKKSLGSKVYVYPTPVWVVGTYDREGKPNIMTVAWGGVVCSKPPCVGISLRQATYTYDCLMTKKAFTVSIPSRKYAAEADFIGMASGRDIDKFKETGLTAVRAEFVDAPFVDEFPIILECKLVHTLEIGLHTEFVGEIVDVKADASVLNYIGVPEIEKINPIVYETGTQNYWSLGDFIQKGFTSDRTRFSKD